MNQTIHSTERASNVLVERRRPGRIEYASPHLIALLRSAGSGAKADAANPKDEPASFALDPVLAKAMGDSISVLDGACQIGTVASVANRNPAAAAAAADTAFLPDRGCYFAGAKIAATEGVVPVENLTAGDVILTASGWRHILEVQALTISGDRLPPDVAPIYMRRHALAHGLPGHDLWLAPTHCVVVGDQLVPALHLVNGLTVLQDRPDPPIHYYRVRYAEQVRVRPAVSQDDLAPVRHRLKDRATLLGFDHAFPIEVGGADLCLAVDGKRYLPVEKYGMRRSFVVPPHQSLQLVSKCDTDVARIEIVTNQEYNVVPADHPELRIGWGAAQHDGTDIWRPLIGAGELPSVSAGAVSKIVVWLQP